MTDTAVHLEVTPAAAAPAAPTPAAAGTPGAAPAAPVVHAKGSPEYIAAAVALYEKQAGLPPSAAPTAPTAPTTPADGTAKPAELPKTPEELAAALEAAKPPPGPTLSTDFDTIMAGLGRDTLDPAIQSKLEQVFTAEQVKQINERFNGLLKLESASSAATLHGYAGGKAQFDALVDWGKANMTPEQAKFYDRELGGPNAQATIELLMTKARASSDPRLHLGNVSAVTPSVTAYRSAAEMQRDMADARYKQDPAFRAEVAAKLRHAKF